ncbi:PAS domain S-box protein [Acidobacteriota bacterium]
MVKHHSPISDDEMNAIRREAMEFAGIGLYRTRLDGTVLFLDRGAAKILELEESFPNLDDLAGKNITDLILFVVPREGPRTAVRRRGEASRLEYKFQTIRGSTKWALLDAYLVSDAETGEEDVQVIIREITRRKLSEKALKETEARNRALLNALPDLIFQIRSDGTFLNYKASSKELLMMSPDAFLGKKVRDVLPPDLAETTMENIDKAIQTGQMQHYEYQVRLPSGEISENEARLVPNAENEVLAIIRDITDRKRAERELLEKEVRYRELFQNMKSGVAVYEAIDGGEDFVFVDFNRAAERIEGVKRREILGRRVTVVFPGVADFGLLDTMMQVWKTGRAKRHPISLYKDERIVGWRENYVHKLPTGEIVAIYDDVTEEKKAEEALRRSERWLATTLNSVGDAVIATDAEGFVSFMNPSAQKLTGWTSFDAETRPLGEVFHVVDERNLERIEDPVSKVIREKKVIDLSNHALLIAKDGTRHPIADSGAPITDAEGTILGVVLVFRDTTEKREMEAELRQRQKLEAIGTLASGVAHEINNPINVIMNFGELIVEDAEDNEKIENNAREVIKESTRIANIVKKLLAFSRHERESHSWARLVDIVNDTLALTRNVLLKDRITLTIDIPEEIPKIKCRSQQLQQVLLNLLTNAKDALNARYTDYDENKIIRITARTFKKRDAQWIRTTVEDHGEGVPKEIVDRIFDPFFTTKPRQTGTGLGLSVSYGIVQDHGGTLIVESEDGEFARFHMDLPTDRDSKDGV